MPEPLMFNNPYRGETHPTPINRLDTVFTLDRRDFPVIRLKRNRTLRLIPDVLPIP